MEPPKAKRIPHPHEIHGDVREDDYYWMSDRSDPDVIEYLEEENRYYDEVMEPLKEKTERIYQKMVDRVPASETQVPVKHGDFFYYSRLEKEKQYPIHGRKKAATRSELSEAPEEVVLDLNEMVAENDYLNVSMMRVNSTHTHLAYLENRDGSDRYTGLVKNLETGKLLSDRIPDVFIGGSLEWSKCGEYIFYITVDENQRPYRLWRHQLGASTDSDELVREETDETFIMTMDKSQSGDYIFVHAESNTTSEVRLLRADEPLNALHLVDARRAGIEYDVEHWGDDLYILTNEGALNGQLLRCPVDDLQAREKVIAHSDDRYLEALNPFQDTLFVSGRENGLTQIWELRNNELVPMTWDEDLYTVAVMPGQSYTTTEVLIQYESLLTPETTYGLDLKTGKLEQLQVQPISGKYDRSEYRQVHVWATAEDGARVPMMMVYREGALDNGPAPLILGGYGSYGITEDPHFSPYRLPLLNRGIVFVTAQVRGGSEMGRHWYEDGKFLNKRNTFTDFLAVARHLIDKGYTTSSQMAAIGGSAGGMLAGAVANMGGDLFQVIVPEVPFVDVVTTMLDTSIPLTTLEWDEWGNPYDEEYYFYMKSYSPYDNVQAKSYPHMYVTTGINDPRVAYWEPAKWVARLRALKTDDNTLVLKTSMGAGHFGASGRFHQLMENAQLYAFMLDKIGVTMD